MRRCWLFALVLVACDQDQSPIGPVLDLNAPPDAAIERVFRFGPRTPTVYWGNPVLLADLDHDGNLDATLGGSGAIWTVFGNGDGTFRYGEPYSGAGWTTGTLFLSDRNGDGHVDLTTLSRSGGGSGGLIPVTLTTFWMPGLGDGRFGAGTGQVVLAGFPEGAISTDLDADGKADLVLPRYLPLGWAFDVILGTATSATSFNGGSSSMVVGDWNGDGKPDLAFVLAHEVAVFFGDGAGNFAAGPVMALPTVAFHVSAGDFDEDGRLDLLLDETLALRIARSRGDGTFELKAHTVLADDPEFPHTNRGTPLVGDFNLDGHSDVIVCFDPDGHLVALLGRGDGAFAFSPPFGPSLRGSCPPLFAGDLNNDGKPDLVVAGQPFEVMLNESM